jgi:hypothetical protein
MRKLVLLTLVCALAVSACSGGGDGGSAPPDPSYGNQWDQMKWDQGNWG